MEKASYVFETVVPGILSIAILKFVSGLKAYGRINQLSKPDLFPHYLPHVLSRSCHNCRMVPHHHALLSCRFLCRPTPSRRRCPCWTTGPTTATSTTSWTDPASSWTPSSPRTPTTASAPRDQQPTAISTKKESFIFILCCNLIRNQINKNKVQYLYDP